NRAQVVAGMTGLALCQVAVVEVEVPDERAVVERRAVRPGTTAADERATRTPVELADLIADRTNRHAAGGAERASKGVQHANLELGTRELGEVVVRRACRERRQLLALGAHVSMSMRTGSSMASLMRDRNSTASRPSMIR